MTPKTRLITILALTLASLPSAASANTIAISAPPEEPLPKRLEFNVGMLLGGLEMGTTRADATGLALSTGVRIADLSIHGEFDYFGVRAAERGTMTRIGITTRYSLVRLGHEKNVATSDLWLEGGVGYERVSWRRGGVLSRPDLAFGIGWQSNVVMDKNSNHPRFLGPFIALRTIVAQGPESDAMATCGGPCDRETQPSSTDVSFMFNMGINWGRMSF